MNKSGSTFLLKQRFRKRSDQPIKWLSIVVWIWLQQFAPGSMAAEGVDGQSEQPYALPLVVQSCLPCHGPRGQSGSPAIPSLAGLPREYLLNVMRAFRHGGRFATVMGRLVQAYDEDDLVSMADYFSQQAFIPPKQTTDWQLVDRGRRLHRFYCRECHGDPETPAEAGVPHLHGRWMDYLRWTLWDYLVGINQGDAEMADQLSNLMRKEGAEGIDALLHYYGKGMP
ncbi:MAG: cytochrome c [Candidatus Thiodiazotropha sp.]